MPLMASCTLTAGATRRLLQLNKQGDFGQRCDVALSSGMLPGTKGKSYTRLAQLRWQD